MSFYDVSFMVSGMLVQQWPSFCPCDQPDGITPSRPRRLDSCQQLIPGLTERDLTNMPRACRRSFALRSLNLSGRSPCPTLWVEDGGESLGSSLLSRLCTPDCGVSRLILAGRKQGSTAQHAVLNCLAQRDCPVRHLVFFDCYYSEDEAANLAKEFQNFQVPLSSLAFVSTRLHINSLVGILRSASQISDLIIHSPWSLSGQKFNEVVGALRKNGRLERLSLTSCELDDSDIRSLAGFLKSSHCFVTALNLSNNPLPEVGMQCLYKALNESKAPKTLQMLSLCGRENHKWVAKETLKFLESPRCGLQVLDLSGRKFCTDSEWIQSLCRILGQQERCQAKLEKLHIFAHDSTTNDSRVLIEALKGPNCGISSITFSWPDPQFQKEAEDAIMSRQNGKKAHESLTHDDIYISQAAEASSSGDGPSRNTHDEYISQASSSRNDPRMEILVRQSLAAPLAAINNRVAAVEISVSDTQTDVAALQISVSDTQTDVAALQISVSDTQTDVAAMNKRMSYTIQLLQNYIQNGQIKELPFLPRILMDVKKTKDLSKPPINIKTDTLYLMCESPIKGFHLVKDQKGLKLQNVKAPPKWLANLMQVRLLVPALKLLFFTTEFVVAHGLFPVSPGTLQSLFKLLINSCNVTHNYPPDKWTPDIKERTLCYSVADLEKIEEQMNSVPRPDRASLEEFYANLLRGSEDAEKLDMGKTFNLSRAFFPDAINFFWVCEECQKDCPDGTKFSNENPFRELLRPKKQH